MSVSHQSSNPITRNGLILLFDIVLFFVLLNTLPFEPAVSKGLALLVFVAVLWLTEALHVTVTALLVPILAIGLGLVKSKEALSAFADPTIFLFFGGFALATALHIQQLDRLIANKIMAMAKGKLSIAVIYLFSVTAFLSMWMSNTATAAMMLPLAMGILSKLDKETHHNTYLFVLLGIAYSASIGGMGTLVGSPPNAIVASQLNLTFADWLKYGLPIMFILMPLMIATLYVVFKPKFDVTFEHSFEKIELNRERIITLSIFGVIAICWVFGDKINPLISGLLGLQGKIGSFDSIVALFAAVLICITRVASWDDIQKNTEWGVLMLFGGGLTLSSVLGQTGASKVMADGIVFLIEDGYFYLIGLLVAAFIIFLTEFTSNTASAALLVPIFISIAQALNMPPVGLALIIGLGASCAFMLPVATPPNAIVFGTGQIKQSEMVKAGFWLNIICIFVIATAGYLFWL
ncbi:DASS family sodium-coupled anion symporter [Glaesserella parasuis]|uniref:Di-and tricarboxylate transporter n=1 Tax=Glaesserella parasuis serovar 5 (strain SH0165) TaxID=557723 RepID=B8F8C4_GLAP5|nr:DASS family sodium-coupled anion symporter [Glaesserella parasuis]ACL33576.1 di- and tricarboxylate transporter [Glaesserella parasuis SH0165]MDG6280205.1 DASS family sodium-coupled anion symporter [Glaesserella parasuis]MDG6358396.1 DASS family sodium-coupled anion symporter [Glaesserella parasuis]MDG6452781.1 DASS family sodium-coupled anion symporter [Glaesserella parasuis]MDG6454826.1 DASS family sodium-coupled anion symporter [Glaesserella parasuis]